MIYADMAATTPLDPVALRAMLPYLENDFYNPSAVYPDAVYVKRALHRSRAKVAQAIGAAPNEIYFTSGGTEADNWVLKDRIYSAPYHIITTRIEHKAILNACRVLEAFGWRVTYLPVDHTGLVDPAVLEAAIEPGHTKLVSIMLANNEVGTIQPIKELAEIAHKNGAAFHTDAVQAVGHIPVDVEELGVDFLSLSGHKFGGPKGTGALYVRKSAPMHPLIDGGGQEWGLRSGTENVPGIVGMGAAIEHAVSFITEDAKEVSAKRDMLVKQILSEVPGVALTGAEHNRLPGHASFIVDGVDSETLVMDLGNKGIYVSAGSACTSSNGKPSYVLKAMGYTDRQAWCSLRITIGTETRLAEVKEIAAAVTSSIRTLRGEGVR